MNLPIEFENRMKRLLGSEYDAFAEALTQEEAVKGLRVNANKLSAAQFAAFAPFDMEAIPGVPNGYVVDEAAQAGKHPYHHAGAYYMQDPGAMTTVAALPSALWERDGLRVLDLCAAPGGKTTQLAAACVSRGGVVLANEYNAARSRILAGNVERMGLTNVCVVNTDTKYIAEWYPDFFDVVAVDAPCSGEGMFRKNELAISEWSPENVAISATRQREILTNGAKCVAPGGYLLYSTCTYATEENEEIVAWFLEQNPSFSLCEAARDVVGRTADGVDITGGEMPELARCRRFYPHRGRGEGQFMALLCRNADDAACGRVTKDFSGVPGKSEKAVVDAFLKETLGHAETGVRTCGGNIVLFPEGERMGFPIPRAGVVAFGATVGELRKGRIVPHHHFFGAYGTGFVSKLVLEPNDPRVSRYLMGEEINCPTELTGYTAVLLTCGDTVVTLGGGKAVGGRLKNHYPKGLRVR